MIYFNPILSLIFIEDSANPKSLAKEVLAVQDITGDLKPDALRYEP